MSSSDIDKLRDAELRQTKEDLVDAIADLRSLTKDVTLILSNSQTGKEKLERIIEDIRELNKCVDKLYSDIHVGKEGILPQIIIIAQQVENIKKEVEEIKLLKSAEISAGFAMRQDLNAISLRVTALEQAQADNKSAKKNLPDRLIQLVLAILSAVAIYISWLAYKK